MGEFDSRDDVVNYLRNIGVNEVISTVKLSATARATTANIGELNPTVLRAA